MRKTPPCPFCGSDDVSLTWYGGDTGEVFRCNKDWKLFAPADEWYDDPDDIEHADDDDDDDLMNTDIGAPFPTRKYGDDF